MGDSRDNDNIDLPDLPTKWNINDKSDSLSVSSDGLEVKYTGEDYSEGEVAAAIRANNPISQQHGFFYFEVSIVDKKDNGAIGVGFCTEAVNLNRMPGLENNSWSYNSSDGKFHYNGESINYGPDFTSGDVIGCFFNLRNNRVCYTKNGIHLGIAFKELNGDNLYPYVGLQGGSVKVNFGHEKFQYNKAITCDDIDELLKGMTIEIPSLYNYGLLDKLIMNLTQSLETEQNNAQLKCRAKFYFITGRYEEALRDFTKLLRSDQNDLFALRYRGEVGCIMRKYWASVESLDQLIELNPNDAEWVYKIYEEIIRKKILFPPILRTGGDISFEELQKKIGARKKVTSDDSQD